MHVIFPSGEIGGQRDIGTEHRRAERQWYLHLLGNGVVIPGIHLAFFSAAHTPQDVDQVFDAFRAAFLALREDGVL